MIKLPFDTGYLLPESRRQRFVKLNVFIAVLILLGFGVCFASLSFLYWKTANQRLIRFINKKSHETPICSKIPDKEKFNCFPDGLVTESECIKRGCCYKPVAEPNKSPNGLPALGTPYCFYPVNYDGYSVINVTQDNQKITIRLQRTTSSGFPRDIKNLLLILTFIDDSTLRIKITDPNNARFEPSIPIYQKPKKLYKPHYIVSVDSKKGVLSIIRKSSGIVVFKTNLSRLVYSDQFLQLSSYLPSSYIYGIGEHYGPFLRSVNWTKLTLFNSDLSPIPNHSLYGSQPFYLSLEPSGKATGVFLLNSNAMDVILQPTPAITFQPIGGILDFFIMLGSTPEEVVQLYTGIIGKPFLPPYWSLGFQLCRWGYGTLNKTRETTERNIQAGIPLDVQWNDIDFMDKFEDFTYDKTNFKGLPEFVKDLHNKGMHYVFMTDPGISNAEKPGTYPPYDDGVKDNIFIKNADGTILNGKVWNYGNTVYPDFSHPSAASYWTKQFKKFYNEVQFDGVWIDMNEPSNFVNGSLNDCPASSLEDPPYLPTNVPLRYKTVCMTAKHYNTVHYNEHNLYGYREAVATNQALREVRGKRPFIISRASFAGQGVYSGHWSGDIFSTWEDMRYTIPSLLNFNLYGMPMIGSDICGFNGNASLELCARWHALGAFYPFSRNHNTVGTTEQDPAALGVFVLAAAKRTLLKRYLLLPYLYTLFYRSHVFGNTVVRPLFFEYPHDVNTYNIDEQFLWGPAVLLIPAVYPGAKNVSSYLPQGVWYYGNGSAFISFGGKLAQPSAIDDIVAMFRGGYIIPTQFQAQTTTVSRQQNFMLLVYLDENEEASGELYWDDGDSLDSYENGKYNLFQFKASKNGLNSTVSKKGYETQMIFDAIQLTGIKSDLQKVTVNGVECKNDSPPVKK
ncbi:lysosomal alpha-glucosidase-like isoform X2 [Stegodyphus dumicola]|uniref:lysosomal alpha-glucosidase-like isoform X2 n=1 Tax=Stegodyphus dumicola TaxID=202533 RepID=UPI0015AD0247|nr:lysosomal alpha-glucosidase-like isoform X2 [Stegodyphus dumicola]